MQFITFLFLVVSLAVHAQPAHTQQFDADAIFQPGMSTMQMAREMCGRAAGPEFASCFVQQMQAAGASQQAVDFMHAIDNNGFMRDFVDTGRVDIAYAVYPFAANENQHVLLINGTPSIIDVDTYTLLPHKGMEKNSNYATLLQKYPNVSVFPGDRYGTHSIHAEKLPDGGQRFLVPYVLVDGCHACARVGTMKLSFNFSCAGKFLGVKVASVQPLNSTAAER